MQMFILSSVAMVMHMAYSSSRSAVSFYVVWITKQSFESLCQGYGTQSYESHDPAGLSFLSGRPQFAFDRGVRPQASIMFWNLIQPGFRTHRVDISVPYTLRLTIFSCEIRTSLETH